MTAVHTMKPATIEFECPHCERRVTVDPQSGDILSIVPGDDTVNHDMVSPAIEARSCVLNEEEVEELLCQA